MSRSSMNMASLPLASPGWISASTSKVGLAERFRPAADLSASVEAVTSSIGWPSALRSGNSRRAMRPEEAATSFSR